MSPRRASFLIPTKDNVSDYSVVVDLDRHAVFGFWFETPTTGMTAVQTALPITGASAIGIFYFVARRKQSAISESISGSVDPITAAVSAMENKLYPSGNVQTKNGICTASQRVQVVPGPTPLSYTCAERLKYKLG
jgi:hypothetical protein